MPHSDDGNPLSGIRVIELASFISGPFVGTALADFGAEVIKIELPGVGDVLRTLGETKVGAEGTTYLWSAVGRNKRSVELDVRTATGRDVLAQMVAQSDILIENFAPGVMEGWGIGPEWLFSHRPDLIVVRISGFGQSGPWSTRRGFDRSAQAFSGLVYLTGDPDNPPVRAGLPICDYAAGLWGAFGAVVALLSRILRQDAKGNVIDVGLYESVLPFMKDIPSIYRANGTVTERVGNQSDLAAPGGAFETMDGKWLIVSGTGDRIFGRIMDVVGLPEFKGDQRFLTNADRLSNREILDDVISGWARRHTAEEILALFEAAEVPVSPVNSIADVMEHPHVRARENFVAVPDSVLGDVWQAAPVPRFSHRPGGIRWAGEGLGASTDAVLKELGITMPHPSTSEGATP